MNDALADPLRLNMLRGPFALASAHFSVIDSLGILLFVRS